MSKSAKPEVLIHSQEIKTAVGRVAREIEAQVNLSSDECLLVICVLKGAFVFTADLLRELSLPCEIEFVQLSSYGAQTESSGEVKMMGNLQLVLKGRSILVVEDIIDTGLSMQFLQKKLVEAGASQLYFSTLLNKPSRRQVVFEPNFVGFEVANEFVVGYGLDSNQMYRNLPYIGVFR